MLELVDRLEGNERDSSERAANDPSPLNQSGLSSTQIAVADQIAHTVSTAEFLGPMAPVALSPFFGVACLSGLAQFGPESIVTGNSLLAANSPLKNPWVLGIFATLAVVTSLPRLTKVSKPIAGALDQVEAWSGIIVMVVLRFLTTSTGDAELAALSQETVQLAGLGEVTLDVALSIAAGVNVLVVNSLRFFFEFLVWITPVPFLDACFEAANKALCTGLMAIYALSPTLSLAINLVLFAVSAIAFLWVRRQVGFFRSLLFDWLLGWFREPSTETIGTRPLVVFPREAVGPFAARERLLLERTDDGWRLSRRGWFGGVREVLVPEVAGELKPGWVAHTLTFDHDEVSPLLIGRRYRRSLTALADAFRVSLAEDVATAAAAKAELGRA